MPAPPCAGPCRIQRAALLPGERVSNISLVSVWHSSGPSATHIGSHSFLQTSLTLPAALRSAVPRQLDDAQRVVDAIAADRAAEPLFHLGYALMLDFLAQAGVVRAAALKLPDAKPLQAPCCATTDGWHPMPASCRSGNWRPVPARGN